MINKWLLVLISVCCVQWSIAQGNDLQVQGASPNLYVVHAVQAKENWYSIGRMYNISPKQLAPFNGLGLDKALAIGQSLKIPLTGDNFSQDGNKAADEVFVPVHHTIQPKEWLFHISSLYNKVPVEDLEKWNGINKDQAKAGLNLVVGYLKVKTGQSSLASKGQVKVVVTAPPVASNTTETKDSKKPEEKKPETKEEKKPVAAPVVENTDVAIKTPPSPAQKEEAKPVVVTPVVNTTNGTKLSYFGNQYEESGKSISGNTGVFKSTSGWNDGKYYALVNNVPVGTIVKVNNPVSGKTIYAKVLGNLPDMKESLGLIARLSDAAAAQIEGAGIKFSVEVRY